MGFDEGLPILPAPVMIRQSVYSGELSIDESARSIVECSLREVAFILRVAMDGLLDGISGQLQGGQDCLFGHP